MRCGGGFVRIVALGMLLGGLLLAACGGSAPSTSLTPAAARPAGDFSSALAAGKAALDAGDLAVAEQRYRDAVTFDPKSAEAQFGLGNALVRQNKLAEAGAAYEAAVARNPNMAAAHANLGVVYYQQGNLTKAAQAFDAALRIDPDDPSTLYLKAAVRIQENNMVEAESLLIRARDLAPTMPEVYYGLGVLYKAKGQNAEAIAAFEKFLELGPGQDPAATQQAEAQLRALKGQ